jgi:hypothetical protein
LQARPPPEVGRRIQRLLEAIPGGALARGELRHLRAIEIMEHTGTLDARQVLETLTRGAAAARLTREAKASLERLKRRAVTP